MADPDKDNAWKQLLYMSSSGSDYDIAKCFTTLFPDCASYTDKDISVKLSEDLCREYHMAAIKYSRAAVSSTDSSGSIRLSEMAKKMNEIALKLKSHTEKKRLLAEIKMIR